MSRTLNLIRAGKNASRRLARYGRHAEAIAGARRMLGHASLTREAAAGVHRMAAQLLVDVERYSEARSHLRSAAALEPGAAATFHLRGVVEELSDRGDDRKAAVAFRRAARLAPGNALYRACYGRAMVRLNYRNRGLRLIAAAVAAAPDDVQTLQIAFEGMLDARALKAAGRALTLARFRRPHDGAVRAMWDRLQFEVARAQQARRRRHDAADVSPAVVPFVRIATTSRPERVDLVRTDVLSLPRPHIARFRATRADR